jgi:N,N-dimethylformamidase
VTPVHLVGYADPVSVAPGDRIHFMISAEGTDSARIDLVRLTGGKPKIGDEVPFALGETHPVRRQKTQVGSFARVPDPTGALQPRGSFTLHAFVWPTVPHLGRRQGILTRGSIDRRVGWGLGLDETGRLEFRIADGANMDALTTEMSLAPKVWYFVFAAYDAVTRTVVLSQQPVVNAYNSAFSPTLPLDHVSRVERRLDVGLAGANVTFFIAGWTATDDDGTPSVSHVFNGKIDRCGLQGRVLSDRELDQIRDGGEPPPDNLVAYWDSTAGYTTGGVGDRIVDVGPNDLHAEGVNKPIRGMTGYNWNGRDDHFPSFPEQYGGVYFHDDALVDCQWDPTVEWTVPELRSGCYALRVRADDAEDQIVFFVRAARPIAKIALLMPTATYLAYANYQRAMGGVANARHSPVLSPACHSCGSPCMTLATGIHPPVLTSEDVELYVNPQCGLSTHDLHSDGEGVCYSSFRRPVLTMRPRCDPLPGGARDFGADLSILGWLEHFGFDYEVVTDHDLHRDGHSLLKPYTVVLTGAHPEYASDRMLDAIEGYVSGGGRFMCLGANAFYWVASFPEDQPWCIEVRRAEQGSREWQARPGEYCHATSGERGGLWRNRARPPQKLLGVGTTARGFDMGSYYRRMPDSYHRSVAWVFDGVQGDTFGNVGLLPGGAAGIDLDRYDLALGTPPHTRILASSEGHSDVYARATEEVMFNFPGMGGTQDFQVHADMTIFTAPNGGAVFATGSRAWAGALSCNQFDNDVSRITANVLRAFAGGRRLPGSRFDDEDDLLRR